MKTLASAVRSRDAGGRPLPDTREWVGVPIQGKYGDNGTFALLDQESAERLGGRRISGSARGYLYVRDGGVQILLHRWVMGCARGDEQIVDHINWNKLDNRRANLRIVTQSQNVHNNPPTGAIPYRGVSWHEGEQKYMVSVRVNGDRKWLGAYASLDEAIRVATGWRVDNLPNYIPEPWNNLCGKCGGAI